jgi:GntR family transcriptional regulator
MKLDKIKIDKRQSTPIPLQIFQVIKALLVDQQINYLEQLPQIEEIASYFEVDSKDVKEAYSRLVSENLLHVEQEKYYANYVTFSSDYYIKPSKLYDIIIKLGLTPSIKTIKKRVTVLPFHLQIESSIKNDDTYIHLKRIYYGNDVPLALMDTYLPYKTFHNIEHLIVDEKPLYDIIFNEAGKLVSSGKRLMTVVNLAREDAKILNAARDTASYQVVSSTYDQHHHLIDISRSISTMNQYFEVDFNEDDIQKIAKNHFFYI